MVRRLLLPIMLVLTAADGVVAQDARDTLRRRDALDRYEAGHRMLFEEVWDRAALEFSRAIELEPLFTAAHYFLGWSYLKWGRYQTAVNAFVAGRDAHRELFDARNTRILSNNALLREELLALRDSLRLLESGRVKTDPLTINRIERRVRDVERDLYRETPRGRFQSPGELSLALGTAYFRLQRFADAEREWEAAVAAAHDLGEAHNNLAALYVTTGRREKAVAAIDAARKSGFPVSPALEADARWTSPR